MKKLVLTLALGMACVSAFAQGTLNFGNANAQVNAKVTDLGTGAGLGGTGWIAQLWYGPAGSTESALIGLPTTATFSTTAAQAGYFFGGSRTIDTIGGGSVAVTQVRVWNAAAGADWLTANASPIGVVGKSGLVNVSLTVAPATPANMVGLAAFTVAPVPEPSSFALAGLGAAALLIFRRRK